VTAASAAARGWRRPFLRARREGGCAGREVNTRPRHREARYNAPPEPAPFLIAGKWRERERGLMAANENWRAMSTRECRRAVRSGTRGTRGDRLVSGFRDSSMIKAAHGSVNSGMFNLLKAMSRLRAFVRPRSFRARRPRLTVEYFSVQRKEREKERERERERERRGELKLNRHYV